MSTAVSLAPATDDDEGPLLPRKPLRDDARFDITAMIDLVFMLNIFFLVTTVTAALAELDLPVVSHCVATDPQDAVMFSIVSTGPGTVSTWLGNPDEGQSLGTGEEVGPRVRAAVEAGLQENKRIVLIKAEKSVRLRDVRRAASAAGEVEGLELRLAVIEKE